MSIQETELDEKIKKILITWGTTSKARYELIKLLDDNQFNEKEMLMAYNEGSNDEYRFQTEKEYNRIKAIDWIKNFKRCPFKVEHKHYVLEKDIIKDHLDTIVKMYLSEQSNVDALPSFIRQFEEEITDTWSVLEFLKYLKENDFQIL